MATLTAEGRREEESVEPNRLARAYLERKGVKLARIGVWTEHGARARERRAYGGSVHDSRTRGRRFSG